jgi:hypothetical protein
MCGHVRLSSDVSEIKLVFSIPPHRPTPNFAELERGASGCRPTSAPERVAVGRTGYKTRAMEAAQDAIKSARDRAQLN